MARPGKMEMDMINLYRRLTPPQSALAGAFDGFNTHTQKEWRMKAVVALKKCGIWEIVSKHDTPEAAMKAAKGKESAMSVESWDALVRPFKSKRAGP